MRTITKAVEVEIDDDDFDDLLSDPDCESRVTSDDIEKIVALGLAGKTEQFHAECELLSFIDPIWAGALQKARAAMRVAA